MTNQIPLLIPEVELTHFKNFFYRLENQEKKFLLIEDISNLWSKYKKELKEKEGPVKTSSLNQFFKGCHEIFIYHKSKYLVYRPDHTEHIFYKLNGQNTCLEEISTKEYLDAKDQYILPQTDPDSSLSIDFSVFQSFFPSIRDTQSIGRGMRFLNRYLSSSLFQDPSKWEPHLFNFLKIHKVDNNSILIKKDAFRDFDHFRQELSKIIKALKSRSKDEDYTEVLKFMKSKGFEHGWGATTTRIVETMNILQSLLNEPSSTTLEEFLSRIPMVSKIAIISPHGYFGQENVLGKPDTGGQVVYILDQVKALEKFLKQQFALCGLENITPSVVVLTRLIPNAQGTPCHQKLEKIFDTDNGWILRVPFRNDKGEVIEDWISRFHIWSYLFRFSKESEKEIYYHLNGKPDLIIGNYSDGNLVASLLSKSFDVTLCTIAHALEKAKYLFSDLYWKDYENDYNFSAQFMADLLAMNKSDFVISSTFEEIAGTENTIGQYESYQSFTLPGLFQVHSGINLKHPKFNVIPPGVDENKYFPFTEKNRRLPDKIKFWENRIFIEDQEDCFGYFKNPALPPIFTMARLDKIKNISGLVQAYGASPLLRDHFNLVIAAGVTDKNLSKDEEEKKEIDKIYELINNYELDGHIKWLPSVSKEDTGEVYRIMADKNGYFVQPALFEAFGLTILEAMSTGLPTFGPKFGGPSEIIQHEKNGYLVNTSSPEEIQASLEKYLPLVNKDQRLYNAISNGGIKRVEEHFTWDLYCQKLMTLTKIYGFWRYAVANKERKSLNHYWDVLYHFFLKNK